MDLMTCQTINYNLRTSPEVFFCLIITSNFSYIGVGRALRPSLLSLLFLCLFVCLLFSGSEFVKAVCIFFIFV